MSPPRHLLGRLGVIVALAATYFVAGKLGLALAHVNASVSAVWPATGIAMAALLILGVWIWPGILIGAFLVNLTTVGIVWSSLGIATGNTLEGVICATLVVRFMRGPRLFQQPRDVFSFAGLAAVATAVSATIGVTSLVFAGLARWESSTGLWLTWWLGDVAGALVVAPLILLWNSARLPTWRTRAILEGTLLAACLLTVGMIVFKGLIPPLARHSTTFLVFTVLMWAAARFGRRVTATAIFALSAIAISGTLEGTGAFAQGNQNESLMMLQAFMAVTSVMTLALAAAVQEHRRAEQRIRRINHVLERRVAVRTKLLQTMNEQLQGSEARLIEAQQVAHIGSWEWDITRNAVSWSAELYRLYGLEPHRFTASYEGFLNRVHPEDRERVHAVISTALQDAKPFRFEHRILVADGAVRTLDAQGRVVVDDQGRPIRMTGTGQDVTERKRVEEGRAELIREQIARREAEETNRVKDEFLAMLSHELRTPLNAIVGWAHLLDEGKLDPADVRRAIETIRRNAQIQSHLISDLLDISRIDSGKLELKFQSVDLVSVIHAALDTVGPAVKAKEVTVVPRLESGVPKMQADPDRIQQVIWNLLSNAMKFAPENGRVEIRLTVRDGRAEIQVEDNGPGVSSKLLPHVFDPFRQGDSSSTRRYKGLGLGLAIVRRLVELHHGTVAVRNRSPQGGAIFIVALPLGSPEPTGSTSPAGTSAAQVAAPLLRGVRVLVVDDEKDSRELVATVLARAGAEVIGRSSAAEALQVVETDRPDLVLTDIEMPGEDGYALLERMRALRAEIGALVPVVALTAHARTEDVARAIAAGFQTHVAKPLDPVELVRIVSELVARAPQQKP
ncbi:MAG TPA: MASE1 domain-containing protein [Candidatus Limnocylindria bacterium]|nr:MASE1 domain-containing protein [Candidatus Limnocylindria bacterium]